MNEHNKKAAFRLNSKTTMVFALIAIWVFFAISTKGAFFTDRNFSNLFRQMSVTGILAMGMVFVIVSKEIDLSVGSFIGLIGGIAAIMTARLNQPDIIVILVTLLISVLIGLFNGYWVAYRRVPSFIVTLAGMLVFRGILIGITKGQTVSGLTPALQFIGQEYISKPVSLVLAGAVSVFTCLSILTARTTKKKFELDTKPLILDVGKIIAISVLAFVFAIVMNGYHGIPFPVLLLGIIAVILNYIANKTVFGRRVYAIGGNIEAARLSGINVKAMKLAIFGLMGLCAGIAGIVLMSRLDAASVAAGQNEELNAIAACVIGGTSMMGGIGTVFGAIIGGLVMASIDNGMTMMNTQPFWQYVVKGLVLLLAVWIDVESKKRE